MNNECPHCDGFWMSTDTGVKRCTYCQRGQELRAVDLARRNPPALKVAPVINEQVATVAVAAMGSIPYFPTDATVRGMIAEEVRSLCGSPAEAVWLVERMIALYSKWPGPRELRIVYAARKVPHDGILPIGTSEVYPDGIPSMTPQQPALRALPPGRPVAGELDLGAAIVNLARAKDIQATHKRLPEGKQITAADVEREREKLRMAKAIAERGEAAR